MAKQFLNNAYGLASSGHTKQLYSGYESEIARMIKERKIRIRWQDYGDHLPKIDLHSMIVVLERIA